MIASGPDWDTPPTGWVSLGATDVTFTTESTHLHPDVLALLTGPEKPATGHTVQLDYQIYS